MIAFDALDLMARGGSVALLALWSWLLVRDHWSALPARMALAMNASIVAHVIATIPGTPMQSTLVDWMFELGSSAVPGFFWLFTRTWFNDEDRIGWRSWMLVLAPILIVAAHILILEHKGPLFVVTGVLMRTLWFGLAVAALWTAWRGREGDLIEARRILRTALVGAVGIFVILTNLIEILVYRGIAPQSWRSFIEFGITALTGVLCATMFGLRRPDLFAAPRVTLIPDESSIDDPATAALVDRVMHHMERERPYRDETLTIAGLAAQLGEQEYRLRRLINGRLGYRNFAAFLNGFRLAEVKEALTDPAQKAVPILTIALDAGFGSLGPFNRAFREAEGLTPSAYRNRAS
jgi:AraC-like DNA-binding protein